VTASKSCALTQLGSSQQKNLTGLVHVRALSEGTHFARAQQRLLQEWFTFHGQLCVSGDDMNIIQVGRPAVSRYNQQRRFFLNGERPEHKTHDFPTYFASRNQTGMMLHSSSRIPSGKRRSPSLPVRFVNSMFYAN
jgi:hypothetical protein